MRRSRNLSGSHSDARDSEHAQSNANGREDNMPTPLRIASGKRKPRPLSGEIDYDSINHPLPKSPRAKGGSLVSLFIQVHLLMNMNACEAEATGLLYPVPLRG